MFIAKEKALNSTLNKLSWQDSSFIGYFWAPLDEQNLINSEMAKYRTCTVNEFKEHNIKRPTFFRINKVTEVYQEIVDTYGIPTYLEGNPAVLTIVTFPFFFGMMFGDMGHGSLLFVLGTLLVFFPNLFKGTDAADFKVARYLLFLMGLFATYCGFIYNEWFAIPTNMQGSCYDLNEVSCSTPLKQEIKPPNGEVGLADCEGIKMYKRT